MAIGRVMDKLEELGIAENTFVFFYSDNGAFYPYLESGIQSNAPFKGAGVTLWEGGIRVPALVRWPGNIEPGSLIDTRLWSLDIFPACAKLGKAPLPEDRFIDGMNPLPVLMGETTYSPHATLFFEYKNFSALHWGDWKIIREEDQEPWQLYNLAEDPGESINAAEDHPQIVSKLAAAFDQRQQEIIHYLEIEPQFQRPNIKRDKMRHRLRR